MRQRRYVIGFLALAAVFNGPWTRPLQAGSAPKREDTEWTDVWVPHLTKSDLPRVLLIGDSITRAYYRPVEAALQGKAYCARIATSKALGDPALLAELKVFLSEEKFTIVHFNIGMHGWGYSESDYEDHLSDLLSVIRKGAPHAKLIWATTTPVRVDNPKGPTNARIRARNEISRRFFEKQDIPIDDLYTLMEPHPEMHSDDVHFADAGIALQGKQVSESILKALEQ